MWCVCAQLYMDQSKKNFDHFICFWKWFLSFFVSMFSAYFVSQCLSMFCVEIQVWEFLATHFGNLQSARPSHEVTQNVLAIHSRLASHETPRISFLKCFFFFLWETCFKTSPILSETPLSIFLHQNPINLNGFSFH